jgi:hypothetical protein
MNISRKNQNFKLIQLLICLFLINNIKNNNNRINKIENYDNKPKFSIYEQNIQIKKTNKNRLLQATKPDTTTDVETTEETQIDTNPEPNTETNNNSPNSENEPNSNNQNENDQVVEEEAQNVTNHYEENENQHHIVIKINKMTLLIIVCCVLVGSILLGLLICGCCFCFSRKKKQKQNYANRLTQSSFNDTRDLNNKNNSNPYLTPHPQRKALSNTVNTIPNPKNNIEMNYQTQDRVIDNKDKSDGSDESEEEEKKYITKSEMMNSTNLNKGKATSQINQGDPNKINFASQQNNQATKVTDIQHKGVLKKVKPKRSKSSKKTSKKSSKKKSKSKKKKDNKNKSFTEQDLNFLNLSK